MHIKISSESYILQTDWYLSVTVKVCLYFLFTNQQTSYLLVVQSQAGEGILQLSFWRDGDLDIIMKRFVPT